jgi:uncharacterized protein YbjT (DUF2867 family)
MILITGATGTIGQQVVAELQARGVPFRVAHRDPARVREVLGPGVESVPFDFEDETTHLPAMQSADKLYLLTPTTEWAQARAIQVIDAAARAGLKHIVRQSVLHADAHPTYSLAETHRGAELYLVASGLPGTLLRPNHFMENLYNFMGDAIRREGKLQMPAGAAQLSFIAGADVAAVAVACLLDDAHQHKSYDLVGPEALTGAEIAATLSRATGRHIAYEDVPEDALRASLTGTPEWLAGVALGLAGFDRSGRMSRINNNVKLITGREPQTLAAWAEANAGRFLSA